MSKQNAVVFSDLCKRALACLFTFLVTSMPALQGQQVNISRDINVRNDFSYDLFNLGNDIYFFRDKGFEYYFDLFDKNLNYRRSVNIKFDERKPYIENVHTIDSFVQICYSFRENESFSARLIRYDRSLSAVDTLEVLNSDFPLELGELRSVLSEDHSKLALFTIDKAKMLTIVIDTKIPAIISVVEAGVPEYRLYDHFQEAGITNRGEVFFLFEKNNEPWNQEKHFMRLVTIAVETIVANDISCINTINSGVKMSIDNLNRKLIITGLYGTKSENETEGYFLFSKSLDGLYQSGLHDLQTFNYDDNILVDLNGIEKKSRKNFLYDFYIKNVIHRADGGLVLVTELQREFTRRNVGISNFDRSMASRGYVDYYSEDLILFSLQPDGNLFWRQILFKKQFSQDDEGIYSSFFIMKVPSQMHIIFNDEIKNNNTVSEYIVDPLGNFKRNSLLSTEYKNLKLRFQDAVQTGSTEFIVPSEKNGRINLVKVIF
ncbi:MAG: hypothetical protein IPN29_18130 [Saprospiraceae bacterium]|nr:hypothetical protein [Saprospiraceae bacterium]